jgi:wyosine [tRNA(Phe)-imidazoG37] synthetase (radical SAM superfamily)
MEIKYDWLKKHKGFSIEGDEDFVYIKYKNKPLAIMYAPATSEEILKEKVNELEKEIKENPAKVKEEADMLEKEIKKAKEIIKKAIKSEKA